MTADAPIDFSGLGLIGPMLDNYWLAMTICAPVLLPVGALVGFGIAWLMGRAR